jgi:transcriptional/translational regulatory protein YebC/TACO1
MSGHSKWHNIRHAKAAHDNMRQNVILKVLPHDLCYLF